jgi:hypothetical protein
MDLPDDKRRCLKGPIESPLRRGLGWAAWFGEGRLSTPRRASKTVKKPKKFDFFGLLD